MADTVAMEIPPWRLLLVPLLLLVLAVMVTGLRRQAQGDENDLFLPAMETGTKASPFHRWDVRCKLLTLLTYAFCVASLRNLPPALLAGMVSLLALFVAGISWQRIALRLLGVGGFFGMLLVVMPFSVPPHPGDRLLILAGLENWAFNLRGLNLALTIAVKGLAVALLSEPLLATAPLPVTLQGLRRLGAPEIVGQMVLLSHRYLHVARQEARRMLNGMRVRGFRRRMCLVDLRALGNFIGMLFVHSFERTERVFSAMQARGYRGSLPEPVALRIMPADLWLSGFWTTLGVLLLIFDRFGS